MQRTVIVIGDGIVGLACAYHLRRAGLATTVVGPGQAATTASWGNAGHLAVEQVEPLASRKAMRRALRQLFGGAGPVRLPASEVARWLPFFLRLVRASGTARFQTGTAALTACMQRAAPAWRALLEDIGHPALLRECGHFVVWESARSASAGLAGWSATDIGPASFREATREEMAQLAALVRRPIHGAIRFEGTGQFTDPGALLGHLERAIVAAGVRREAALVTRIEPRSDGGAMVETDAGESLHADAIVVAAGVASASLLAPTTLRAPIIAERGYHIQAPTDGWPDGMPPVVFEDRSMIVTNFTSGLRASGFVEFARADRPPDPSRWRVLERHLAELGLPFGVPAARWMGPRPTLPDYLPAIGRSPRWPAVCYAFGHQHLGLTMAVVTAEIVRDLVTGTEPPLDIRPFDLTRFA
jgi:D-amino-acid dehydrogenase